MGIVSVNTNLVIEPSNITNVPTTPFTGEALSNITEGAQAIGLLASNWDKYMVEDAIIDIVSGSVINCLAFSSDGQFLALGTSSAPYLEIYKIDGNKFNVIDTSNIVVPGSMYSVTFSVDNKYLAFSHLGAPYSQVCEIKEVDSLTIFENVVLPTTSSGYSSVFSPDSKLLVFGGSSSSPLHIYSINNGVFTKIANPTTLPAGQSNGVAFSGDGTLFAVAHNASPYLSVYSVLGNVFTKLASPTTNPSGTGYSVAFSANKKHLAVGYSTTPFLALYSISGTTFTKLSNPVVLPSAAVKSLDFSADSLFLVTGAEVLADAINMYKISTNTFTEVPSELLNQAQFVKAIAFNSKGNFLAFGRYLRVLNTVNKDSIITGTLKDVANLVNTSIFNGFGYARETATTGAITTMDKFNFY